MMWSLEKSDDFDSLLSDLQANSAELRNAYTLIADILSDATSDVRWGAADAIRKIGKVDEEALAAFASRHRNDAVLIYGFTTMLWTQLVRQLAQKRICLGLSRAHVLHSGGWKKLTAEAVTRDEFNLKTAEVVGCAPSRVIDFYGMVENLGIIYPDCSEGNKHAPVTGEVIVRNALTLKPVKTGEVGLVQVCSVLPSSFPGHLLLTEDTAQVMASHVCRCGRSGLAFRFAGRGAKAEARGCGNAEARRMEQFAEAS